MTRTHIPAIIIISLVSITEVPAQSVGDPNKGSTLSLEETEHYIAKIVNGTFITPILHWVTVNAIQFTGTQVILSDKTLDKNKKFLSAGRYFFDLKDLDPNNVEIDTGGVKLHTLGGRKAISVKDSTGLTDSADYMLINIGYLKTNTPQYLANAFAHAIVLAGGRIERHSDPFQ